MKRDTKIESMNDLSFITTGEPPETVEAMLADVFMTLVEAERMIEINALSDAIESLQMLHRNLLTVAVKTGSTRESFIAAVMAQNAEDNRVRELLDAPHEPGKES
jgi:hypothetical protein